MRKTERIPAESAAMAYGNIAPVGGGFNPWAGNSAQAERRRRNLALNLCVPARITLVSAACTQACAGATGVAMVSSACLANGLVPWLSSNFADDQHHELMQLSLAVWSSLSRLGLAAETMALPLVPEIGIRPDRPEIASRCALTLHLLRHPSTAPSHILCFEANAEHILKTAKLSAPVTRICAPKSCGMSILDQIDDAIEVRRKSA